MTDLGVLALRDKLAAGEVTALAVAEACIDRIVAREPEVKAWAWFDPEAVRTEAGRLDALHAAGGPVGPLHGLPVGVKDVIDTAGLPTENGCPVDSGRVPTQDAAVVTRLKAAGGVMFGKTVTTELAFMHPGATRNPHNLGRTPGGSSSGSAAAVADGMVPLAIGTQTGGSVIRPAAFCGITGFKPTFNAIPRDGTLLQSHSLDTLGVFARDPMGAALLAEALCASPAGVGLVDAVQGAVATAPRLAFVRGPGWATSDPLTHRALERLCAALGAQVTIVDLPAAFDDVTAQRGLINTAEMAHHFSGYYARGAERLGPPTRVAIEEGQALKATGYLAATDVQAALSPALEAIWSDFDAILCPAALGPAPEGLGFTGDSICNGLWTMAGTPAVTLPLFHAPNGLPVGAQVVGPVGQDARLMGVAQWLWQWAQEGHFDPAL